MSDLDDVAKRLQDDIYRLDDVARRLGEILAHEVDAREKIYQERQAWRKSFPQSHRMWSWANSRLTPVSIGGRFSDCQPEPVPIPENVKAFIQDYMALCWKHGMSLQVNERDAQECQCGMAVVKSGSEDDVDSFCLGYIDVNLLPNGG